MGLWGGRTSSIMSGKVPGSYGGITNVAVFPFKLIELVNLSEYLIEEWKYMKEKIIKIKSINKHASK